ncbi:hypothetical protein DTO164E3_8630 [Paecilomyces variotii]|uniref:Sodium/calcium exchanger protein n=1 Tax=Byssochlamys spectabilis TaxID=264951 RepID=A0A443HMU6_BYSSP|nr:sodium/calcium exchanger protein [Paecilomyces variotii]KAJ9191883.1 hypothetical protein DTO164E3_8630 [Paecilomyces variotii]KAJ9200565.1 hypothetical protein DTO032I3_4447 [Paecilomyces variotii]KAJ9278693.1 hypothetical protein DTO021D3_4316 [Paecilomyces variotii]KAJ9289598.1 hypothetical protein DTO021C3_2669 [Paecilomyces variotii]KAJ9313373.1 hypothetical protein DTO271D3_6432 [Paecilomyces variotii]
MLGSLVDDHRPAIMPRRRRFSVRPFYLTICFFTVIIAANWLLKSSTTSLTAGISHYGSKGWTRAFTGTEAELFRRGNEPECHLVRKARDKCAFVKNNCPDYEEGLFSYLQLYYCNLADAKPVAFTILVLWLSLLFSTIGIAASDFLCINLSTLASILGMSESLTGVTFLAFGNGSPDVFSTFAAMRSNSGSLAVGELVGAAGFITSVVAGSMALVRPFRVARRSFVRDVGYFVIAIGFTMIVLADGRLHAWECAAMVALYLFYVVMVVTWHWYLGRQRKKYERDLAARTQFHIPENQELDIEERPEDDDPRVAQEDTSLLRGSRDEFDALERSASPAWKDDTEDDETRDRYLAEISDNMHITRPGASRRKNTFNPIRPSLVGALEFQSVLSSLRRARNMPINLRSYSDDPYASSSQHQDNLSIRSNPPTEPSDSGRYLSPARQSLSRARAVSADHATALRLDTSFLGERFSRPPNQLVRGAPEEALRVPDHSQPGPSVLVDSRSPSGYPLRNRSPAATERILSPDHLAPPVDDLRALNYQSDKGPQLSSPAVSPRGTTNIPQITLSPEMMPKSPLSPFPAFSDAGSTSSRAASIFLSPAALPPEASIPLETQPGGSRLLRWWPSHMLPLPHVIFSTLFPTICDWKTKSLGEKFLGLVAAPSVFLLTVTLPVAEPPQSGSSSKPEPVIQDQSSDDNMRPPLIRLPEDSPVLTAEGGESSFHGTTLRNSKDPSATTSRRRLDSELPAHPADFERSDATSKEWQPWLICIQLFTAPFFIVLISWTNMDPEMKARNLLLPAMISLLLSLVCFVGLLIITKRANVSQLSASTRPLLALLGFLVAISWIATIATEVVSLLKTFGVILDISDSLLGLTVFAVGNSLGDLVADVTVARLGYPVMALSACFGGPMLNILLGIGLGGLYMTLNSKSGMSTTTSEYNVNISKTLVISGSTLLVTLVGLLVIVPLNRWKMDRKIGWGLVALWCVSTVGNVIAEIFT